MSAELIVPPRLALGDVIGVLSPSAPAAGLFPHRLERGVAALRRMGFRVKVARGARRVAGYVAGSPRQRAADLHELFRDRQVRAVVAAIGGNHSNQLLPLLDSKLIRAQPKIFVGYSDVTVLHLALHAMGLRTFYGPALLTQFAENPEPLPYTTGHFLRALTDPQPLGRLRPSPRWTDEFLDWGRRLDLRRPRRLKRNAGPVWLRKGRAQGPLLGGCLMSLLHLRGTPYWPDWRGAVLFWETPEGADPAHGRSLSDVESALADLELSGVFDAISGMVVGRPYGYSPAQRRRLGELVRAVADRRRIPALYGADFGHTDPMLTLPVGAECRLDGGRDEFSILEGGVC